MKTVKKILSRSSTPNPSRTNTPVCFSEHNDSEHNDKDLLKYRLMIESLENSGFIERHIEKQKLNKFIQN